MSKILLTFLFIVGTLTASAQVKVVESSSRKMPSWVDKVEDGYIVVSAVAPSIEAAQNQCMDQVKTQVIESVAQNIAFSSHNTVEQKTSAAGIDSYNEQYRSSLKTHAANVPFVRGISISKATDSYWAKMQDKATNAISYRYALKYPFPAVELKKLIMEFESQDKKMVERMNELKAAYDNVSSVDQIGSSISDLESLVTYFFDDVRKGEAKSLQAAYRKLYDRILVQTVSEELGKAEITFLLSGRQIACSERPQIKAQCATQIKYVISAGNQHAVEYNYEQCIEGEGSEISLSYRFGAKPVVHTIHFTPIDQTVAIAPVGNLTLVKDVTDSTHKLTIWMDLKVRNCGQLNVNSMTLNLGVLASPLVLESVGASYKGDGTHQLKIEYNGKLEWVKSFLLNVAKGSLNGTYGEAKTPFAINFTLPYRIN